MNWIRNNPAVAIFGGLVGFGILAFLAFGVFGIQTKFFDDEVAEDGPVIIDFPQVVSAAGNNAARAMLLRDVHNLRDSLGRKGRRPTITVRSPILLLPQPPQITPHSPLQTRERTLLILRPWPNKGQAPCLPCPT